jgi:hypothetical protein
MYNTPVLLLIFNRPEPSARVLEAIRQQKPARMYIAADGPRKHKSGEQELCELTRKAVIEKIDWECRVETLFRDENLGCGRAVSEAISWFFTHEEAGIILEDDCVPNESFFLFCAEVLERYRDNQEVMHISGTELSGCVTSDHTYHFSRYPNVWGWATWRRAWKNYDLELKDTGFYNKLIETMFKEPFERRLWKGVLRSVPEIDTWDYQWIFAIWKAKGLCANTNHNLVLNIGFDDQATHTTYENPYANKYAEQLPRIVHPPKIERDKKGEDAFLNAVYNLDKRGYGRYFLFRGRNLVHKIKKALQKGNGAA